MVEDIHEYWVRATVELTVLHMAPGKQLDPKFLNISNVGIALYHKVTSVLLLGPA